MREICVFITGKPGCHSYKSNLRWLNSFRKIIPGSLSLLLLFCFNNIYAQGPGTAWEYSRSITLSSGTAVANFQVKVTLSAGQYTNMKADGSDLRFYDNSNAICNYWIEKWDNTGNSVIWIKVTTSGTNSLKMFYGNPAAVAVSDGNSTFDFFDDFLGNSLNANWIKNTSGGTITMAGGQVTLSNTSTGAVSMASQFTPGTPAAFVVETKHKEGAYHRNRFLVTDGPNSTSPLAFDYGYFNGDGGAQINAKLFWNGYGATVFAKDIDYLTTWDITNASTYTWSNYNYNSGALINSQTSVTTKIVRYLIFNVTEQAGTSTSIDWARVRKAGTTIVTAIGAQATALPVPAITSFGSTGGCAGTNIIINGTGFTTAFALSVKIGGTDVASVISNNGTTIVAVIGNGTTGNVSVTTGGGTGTSAQIFTVNPAPVANAGSALSAICQGSISAGLGGSISGSATSGTWNDNGVGGVFSPDATALNATWAPPVNYSGTTTLTLTATGGSCANASASKTLLVNPLPSGLVNATATSICAGSSITFTAPAGYYSYVFKVNGATALSGSANTFSPANLLAGSTVSVVIGTNAGCSATFPAPSVMVNQYPSGTFSTSENSGTDANDNIICQGDLVNFDFDNTAGNTNYKFILNGATTLYDGPNPYYSTSTLNNGSSVTLEITGQGGCVKTFGPQLVTVKSLPTGSLTAEENSGTANDNKICVGSAVKFIAPAGLLNYDFQVNGSSVQSGPSNFFNTNLLNNNDVVSVIVTNANNCSSALGPVSITVSSLPPVSAITGTLAVCVNGTTKLSDATSGGLWKSLNTGIATIDASGVLIGISAGSATINYTITNTNGCDSTVSILVNVNALPTVTAITGSLDVCPGNSIQLSDATTGGIWSGSNSTVATINASGLVNGISEGAATMIYTITNGNGCTTAVNAVVTVHALPAVSMITGTLSACAGSTTQLSDATGGGVWHSDNTAIATVSAGGVITGIAAGTATISYAVTNANGCLTAVAANVSIHSLPDVTLSGPNPICIGSTGNLYVTEAGQSAYSWNITGGAIEAGGSGTDNSVTVSWTSPGAKKINVNYQNTNGCAATTSATFTNSPAVVPVLTGPSAVCLNSTGNVYTTDALKDDYTWTVTGGSIISGGGSSDNTATVTWNSSGTQSVSINYANADGCNAATPTLHPVTVNTLPSAVISGTTSVCQNSAAPNITFTGATGKRPYTFTYNINGLGTYTAVSSATSNTAFLSVATATPGVVTYNLISVSDANGCSQPASGSATVTVTVAPSTTISYGGTTFCTSGAAINVALSGTPAGTFSAVSGLSINSADGTIIPSSSIAGTYTVTYSVASFGGCAVYTTTTPVTIVSLPTAAISYTNSAFCRSVNTAQPAALTGSGSYTTGSYSAANGLSINAITGAVTPGASTAGTYTVTYTIPSAGACGAVVATTSVTITDAPSASISYQATPACATLTSLPVALSGSGAYTAGTYSSSAGLSIDALSGSINPSLSAPGTYTVRYNISNSGGCASIQATTSVTILPAPTVNAGTPVSTCAASGAVNITAGSVAANYSLVTWTSNGTGSWTNANSLTTATYNPGNADISSGSVLLTLTALGSGNCGSVISTKTLTVNAAATPFVVKPANTSLCAGTIQPLTSVKDAASDIDVTFSSGDINLSVPDDNPSGVYSSVMVSGIPAGAIINSVSVKFNITHTYDADLFINLKAPNNKVLNIANGLDGFNFTNTVISSIATKPIQTFGVSPFTGTYLPQAQTGITGAGSVPGGSTQNTAATFTDLYSILNGNWYFSIRDGGAGDIGKLTAWTITINYSMPAVPVVVTWTPATGLYTDAAATIPYTGQGIATVYAKPASSGAKTYTATAGNAAGCSSYVNVSLTVKPTPVVPIVADYCATPGNVTLTANSPGAVSYNWSTGETTQTVSVDISHDYYVSVTNSDGCVGTTLTSVAQELVVNGDFSAGNTGFITDYAYKPDLAGVNNELMADNSNNGYAIGTNGQNYHPNFYGIDHSRNQTGDRNFMLVNGHGNTLTIWKETVNVLPNTDYYFSAWAMSLNNIAPFAKLQFEVNGVKVGTVANLVAGSVSEDESAANNHWIRFYSNPKWNSGSISGPITIRIVNNEDAANGNDFALDDISFGTLSPFVTGPGVDGTDQQTICEATAIEPITYKVGSGATGPQVSGLPPGVTYTYDGLTVLISGVPTASGTFNYTVATSGSCPNPKAATGTIRVNPKAVLTLTSAGNNAQTICINSAIDPVTYSFGGGATAVSFSGLPSGITASNSNGIATLTGSPSLTGTFNYQVKTTGTCAPDSLAGIISISPASAGGVVSSPTICIGDGGTLTLTGNVGNIHHWEISNDGTAYTIIDNTSGTQSFTNITQSAFYRVQVKNDACPAVYSTGGKIRIRNLWEGKFSSDWSTPQNWSSGSLPDNSCGATVTIPKVSGINFYPVLTGTATVTNLNILANGRLTINGGNLLVAGAITSNGILDAANGGLEFNGAAPQTVAANTFLDNKVKDLKISNATATGVTLNGPVDVYRSLTYGTLGKNLNTGGFLTLKSTATETAWIGDMTGHNISGDVTVERYIGTGTGSDANHGKSWQLLAIPTVGQTIKQAWQEGAVVVNGNPNHGFGTMLTSDVPNAATQPSPGFDVFTATGPSIKVFNTLTNNYDGPVSTQIPVYNQKGYFIFVRGDRSVISSFAPAIPTVLRTKGKLFTPSNPPPVTTVAEGKFESVGNPYASALDMRKIIKSAAVNDVFQVWDPRLGGGSNYGGFQTFVKNPATGNYEVNPGNGSYGAPGSVSNFIQSGQAFMVQTTGGSGTVSFAENSKVGGSLLFSRVANGPRIQLLRTGLYNINNDGSTTIIDGVLNNFDDSYSNAIDRMDARKISNSGENLSIMTRGQLLVVERKQPIAKADTIFLNLTGLRAQAYQFQFNADITNIEGLAAFLEDNYLRTRTPLDLSGSTLLTFNVENVAGSYAADRFRIVFAPVEVLPVTFTSVKATRQDKNINIEWKVENEMDIKQYEVEKSTNGTKFTSLVVKAASANGGHSANYAAIDVDPVEGYNYYRIKSLDINGKIAFTNIVKVQMGSIKQDISIYPNPITDGAIHLQLLNQPAGIYGIRLVNKLGQVIMRQQVNHAEGSSTEVIKWNYNLAHGIYMLEVTKPDRSVRGINVMY